MKYLKALFIGLLVVIVILCIGIFIFIKTFDANKYKDQISQRISEELNKPVDIGNLELHLSLADGVRLEINQLNIEGLAKIESTYVVLDVNAYLKKKEIVVTKVIIKEPNIDYVIEKVDKDNSSNEIQLKDIQPSQDAGSQESLPDFTVKLVEVIDGRIELADHSSGESKNFTFRRLNAKITNFSLNRSFDYELAWALFSDNKENFNIKGKGIYYSSNQNIRLHDLKVDVDIGLISKDLVMKSLPELDLNSIEYWKGGLLSFNLDQILLTKDGLDELNILGKLDNLNVKFADFNEPISVASDFTADESNVQLDQLLLQVAGGEIKGSGQIKQYLTMPDYNFALDITNLDISKLVDPKQLPKPISGYLNGSLAILGKGLDKAALENHLSGQGQIAVVNGEIKDFNLLRYVIDSVSLTQVKGLADQVGVDISSFENFSQDLRNNLSDRYKNRIDQKNTVLNDVTLKIKITAGHIFLDPIRLEADGFIYNAKSDIDLEQNLEFNSSIYLAEDFSQSMIKTEGELSFLMDEFRQLRIPFTDYKGSVAKFKTYPSFKGLSKQVIRNKGRDELRKALKKVINSDEKKVAPLDGKAELTPDEAPVPKKEEPQIEDVIADTVIDIFSNF